MERVPSERPFVAVNMITTLDGRAALGGNTKELGSDADTEHLVSLRTGFDAVLIGAGTMRAERYGPIISRPAHRQERQERGLSPDALAVIVSGDLDLPFDAPLFTSGRGRVVIFSRGTKVPETATPVELVAAGDRLRMAEVLEHLYREERVRTLLCEGGPHLFGQLVAEDLVDELYLTVTPVLTGGEALRVLEGDLPDTASFELVDLSEEEGDVFARYRRQRPSGK